MKTNDLRDLSLSKVVLLLARTYVERGRILGQTPSSRPRLLCLMRPGAAIDRRGSPGPLHGPIRANSAASWQIKSAFSKSVLNAQASFPRSENHVPRQLTSLAHPPQ